MTTLALFELFTPWHMLIIGLVALLVFGRRLPEVGRNLGRGITEFKRGLKDVQREAEDDNTNQQSSLPPYQQSNQPRAYVSQSPSASGPARLTPPGASTPGREQVRVSRQDMVD